MVKPPDAKPSLAEQLEGLAATMSRCDHVVTANGEPIWIFGDWVTDVNAIAAELREIAEEMRVGLYEQVVPPWADRLARREP